MTRLVAVVLTLLLVFILPQTSRAHEVRPAYLEIDQTGPATFKALWKQPTMGDVAIHLTPHLSNGWLEKPPADQYAAAGFLIRSWKINSAEPASLSGKIVSIEGLADTLTDVFVRVRLLNGQGIDTIVRPEQPEAKIALVDSTTMATSAFLVLGVQHILTGPDHLLFVLGLLLLVKDRWMLLKTVSSFTAAHSLTLAAATLGLVSVSTLLLNILIALSILFLAVEVLRVQRGRSSAASRYPWAIAFAFGLLHGLGFASGLTSLGLDRGALLGGLVFFNIGVEIGQIAFILLVLALRRAFRLMAIVWPRPMALTPTYAIGVLGAAWTFQYAALVFGAGA